MAIDPREERRRRTRTRRRRRRPSSLDQFRPTLEPEIRLQTSEPTPTPERGRERLGEAGRRATRGQMPAIQEPRINLQTSPAPAIDVPSLREPQSLTNLPDADDFLAEEAKQRIRAAGVSAELAPLREEPEAQERAQQEATRHAVAQMTAQTLTERGVDVPAEISAEANAVLSADAQRYTADPEWLDRQQTIVQQRVEELNPRELEPQGAVPEALGAIFGKITGGLFAIRHVPAALAPHGDVIAAAKEIDQRKDLDNTAKRRMLEEHLPDYVKAYLGMTSGINRFALGVGQRLNPRNFVAGMIVDGFYGIPMWAQEYVEYERSARSLKLSATVAEALPIPGITPALDRAAQQALGDGADASALLYAAPWDIFDDEIRNLDQLADEMPWQTFAMEVVTTAPLGLIGGASAAIGLPIRYAGVKLGATGLSRVGSVIQPLENVIYGYGTKLAGKMIKLGARPIASGLRAATSGIGHTNLPFVSVVARQAGRYGASAVERLRHPFAESRLSQVSNMGRNFAALSNDLQIQGFSDRQVDSILEQMHRYAREGRDVLEAVQVYDIPRAVLDDAGQLKGYNRDDILPGPFNLDQVLTNQSKRAVRRLNGILKDPVQAELERRAGESIGQAAARTMPTAVDMLPDARKSLFEFFQRQDYLAMDSGQKWRALRGISVADHMAELGLMPRNAPTYQTVLSSLRSGQITLAAGQTAQVAYRMWREAVLSTPVYVTQQMLDGAWRGINRGMLPWSVRLSDYARGGPKFGTLRIDLQERVDDAVLDPVFESGGFGQRLKAGLRGFGKRKVVTGSMAADILEIDRKAGPAASMLPFMRWADRLDLAIRIRQFEVENARATRRLIGAAAGKDPKAAFLGKLMTLIDEPFDPALGIPQDVAEDLAKELANVTTVREADDLLRRLGADQLDDGAIRNSSTIEGVSSEILEPIDNVLLEVLRTGDEDLLDRALLQAYEELNPYMERAAALEADQLDSWIEQTINDRNIPEELRSVYRQLADLFYEEVDSAENFLRSSIDDFLQAREGAISSHAREQLMLVREAKSGLEVANALAKLDGEVSSRIGLDRLERTINLRRLSSKRFLYDFLKSVTARALREDNEARAVSFAVREIFDYHAQRQEMVRKTITRADTLRMATLEATRGVTDDDAYDAALALSQRFHDTGRGVDVVHLDRLLQNDAGGKDAMWRNYFHTSRQLWSNYWVDAGTASIDKKILIETGEAMTDDQARLVRNSLRAIDDGDIELAHELFREAGLPIREAAFPAPENVRPPVDLDNLSEQEVSRASLDWRASEQVDLEATVGRLERTREGRVAAQVGREERVTERFGPRLAEAQRKQQVATQRVHDAILEEKRRNRRRLNNIMRGVVRRARKARKDLQKADSVEESLYVGDVRGVVRRPYEDVQYSSTEIRRFRNAIASTKRARRTFEENPDRLIGYQNQKGQWRAAGASGRAIETALDASTASADTRANLYERIVGAIDLMTDGNLWFIESPSSARGQQTFDYRRFSDAPDSVKRVIHAIMQFEKKRIHPSRAAYRAAEEGIPIRRGRPDRAASERAANFYAERIAAARRSIDLHGMRASTSPDFGKKGARPSGAWRQEVNEARNDVYEAIFDALDAAETGFPLATIEDYAFDYPSRYRDAVLKEARRRARKNLSSMVQRMGAALEAEVPGTSLNLGFKGILRMRHPQRLAGRRLPSGFKDRYRAFARLRDAEISENTERYANQIRLQHQKYREFETLWASLSAPHEASLSGRLAGAAGRGNAEIGLKAGFRGRVGEALAEVKPIGEHEAAALQQVFEVGDLTEEILDDWGGEATLRTIPVDPESEIFERLRGLGLATKPGFEPLEPELRELLGQAGTVSEHVVRDKRLEDLISDAAMATERHRAEVAKLEGQIAEMREPIARELEDLRMFLDPDRLPISGRGFDELPPRLRASIKRNQKAAARLQEALDAQDAALESTREDLANATRAIDERLAAAKEDLAEVVRARGEAVAHHEEVFGPLKDAPAEAVTFEELVTPAIFSTPRNQKLVTRRAIEAWGDEIRAVMRGQDSQRVFSTPQKAAMFARGKVVRDTLANFDRGQVRRHRRIINRSQDEAMREVDEAQVGYTTTSNMLDVMRPFFPFLRFGVFGTLTAYKQAMRHPVTGVLWNYYYRLGEATQGEQGPYRGRPFLRVGPVGIDPARYLTLGRFYNPNAITSRELNRRYLDEQGASQIGKILDGAYALGPSPGPIVDVPTRVFANIYDRVSGGTFDDPQDRPLLPQAEFFRQVTGTLGVRSGRGLQVPLIGAPPGRDFALPAQQQNLSNSQRYLESQSGRNFTNSISLGELHSYELALERAATPEERTAARGQLEAARLDLMRGAQQKTSWQDLVNQWIPFVRLGVFSSEDDMRRQLETEIINYFGIPAHEQEKMRREGIAPTHALNRVQRRIIFDAVPGLREAVRANFPFRSQDEQAFFFAQDNYFEEADKINLEAQREIEGYDAQLELWVQDPAGQIARGNLEAISPETWGERVSDRRRLAREARDEVRNRVLRQSEIDFNLPAGSLGDELFPADEERYIPFEDRLLDEFFAVWDDERNFIRGAGGVLVPDFDKIYDKQAKILEGVAPQYQGYVMAEARRYLSDMELRRIIARDQYDQLRDEFPRWSKQADRDYLRQIEMATTIHRRIHQQYGKIEADKFKSGTPSLYRMANGDQVVIQWEEAPGLFALRRSLDDEFAAAKVDREVFKKNNLEMQIFYFWRSTYLPDDTTFDAEADALLYTVNSDRAALSLAISE